MYHVLQHCVHLRHGYVGVMLLMSWADHQFEPQQRSTPDGSLACVYFPYNNITTRRNGEFEVTIRRGADWIFNWMFSFTSRHETKAKIVRTRLQCTLQLWQSKGRLGSFGLAGRYARVGWAEFRESGKAEASHKKQQELSCHKALPTIHVQHATY